MGFQTPKVVHEFLATSFASLVRSIRRFRRPMPSGRRGQFAPLLDQARCTSARQDAGCPYQKSARFLFRQDQQPVDSGASSES